MPPDPRTLREVTELVSKQFSVKLEKISDSTRMAHDLGLDGDDAWEFMEVFAERFGVEMKDFDFSRHFGDEAGADPITLIYYLIFRSQRPKTVPISIKDLAISAESKIWVRPLAEPCSW